MNDDNKDVTHDKKDVTHDKKDGPMRAGDLKNVVGGAGSGSEASTTPPDSTSGFPTWATVGLNMGNNNVG